MNPIIMSIDQGWLSTARKVPSPNFNQRPASESVRLLVLHNISLPPAQFDGPYIEQFFTNQLDTSQHPYFETIAGLEVSAHLLIRRDGSVIQFVSFDERAWHAGASSYLGVENCNDYSIGIELEGADHIAYTDAQYGVLAEITQCLQAHYAIGDNIVGHSDIAPGRKTDPGEAFDWPRFWVELNKSRVEK